MCARCNVVGAPCQCGICQWIGHFEVCNKDVCSLYCIASVISCLLSDFQLVDSISSLQD